MHIRKANEADINCIAPLIAQFRMELKQLKDVDINVSIDTAKEECMEYLHAEYPIFIWKEKENCLGYLVCRVAEPIVWVESLYVLHSHRRRGIASALFDAAERLAASYGEEMVYNYVHPNNDVMLAFLRRKGYEVLNLIEIRKAYPKEINTRTISVGKHEFKYP